MKLFVCNDHGGHWPVPTASVVLAKDEDEAKAILSKELERRGLRSSDFTLVELDCARKQVVVLSDGEY